MTGFDAFLWEFIGTALLLLLGNGVCALVNLRTSGCLLYTSDAADE